MMRSLDYVTPIVSEGSTKAEKGKMPVGLGSETAGEFQRAKIQETKANQGKKMKLFNV